MINCRFWTTSASGHMTAAILFSDGRFFSNKNLINVLLYLRHVAKVVMVEVVKRLEIIEGRRLGLGLA